MKFTEMLELAKNGYSLADIKEMAELEKAEKEEPTPQPKEEPTPQPKEEPTPQPKEEPTPQPKEEPKEDYKKLYEESQAVIKSLQEQNIKQDAKGIEPKEEDILADLVKAFM